MSSTLTEEMLSWAHAFTGVLMDPTAILNTLGATNQAKPTKSMKTDHGVFTYYADKDSELSSMLGPTFKLYETAYRLKFQVDKQFAEMQGAANDIPATKDVVNEVGHTNDVSLDNAATVFELSKKTLATFEDQFKLFEADLTNAESQVKIAQMDLDANKKNEEAAKLQARAETFDLIFKTIGDLVAMANPVHDALKAPEKLFDAVAPFLDMVVPQINALKEDAKKLQDEAAELQRKAAEDGLAAAQSFFDKMIKLIPQIRTDMNDMKPLVMHLYVNNEKQYDTLADKDKTKRFRFSKLSQALQVASACARLWKQAETAAFAAYHGVEKLAGLVIGTFPDGNPAYIPPSSQSDSMVVIGEMFARSKKMFDEATPKRQQSEAELKRLEETRDAAHRALSKA